jgi:sRNA-binding carbon storage regulator CsrA
VSLIRQAILMAMVRNRRRHVRLVVTVMEIRGNRVKLAFNAPASVSIDRAERLENGVGETEASLLTLELPAQSPEVEKGEAVAVA